VTYSPPAVEHGPKDGEAAVAQPIAWRVDQLAASYRRRRGITPEDVVEWYLERIGRHDPVVRSMVTVTADLARRHARAAARRLAEGDPGPLVGIPVVVKDLIDVRGVRTTAGSAVLADHVAPTSSVVWKRLERAGAVLLGKANTHEFAYGGTTEPTTNPWNPQHLVGGSSGGPAAALAAGLAPLAIGTDTAGSIRIPANLCGVVGFMPSRGLVSAEGVTPLSPSLDVVGPMGHHPLDMALAMSVLDTGVGASRRAWTDTTAIRRRASARRLRFGVLAEPGRMTAGAAAALERTVTVAKEFGSVTPVRFAAFEESVYTNFTILGLEAVVVHDQWRDQRHLYTNYVRERLDEASRTTAADYARAMGLRSLYREQLDQLLADHDVLLLPGIPYPAPPLGVTSVDVGGVIEDRDTSMCRNMGFANLTGHPVLALPAGEEGGLPVGVQVVGCRGGDVDLLAIGGLIADGLDRPDVAPAFVE